MVEGCSPDNTIASSSSQRQLKQLLGNKLTKFDAFWGILFTLLFTFSVSVNMNIHQQGEQERPTIPSWIV